MNQSVIEAHVQKALKFAKNDTATRMDGCLYELWKALNHHHTEKIKLNKPTFDIVKSLTKVFQDIQTHGVNKRTNFAFGWMLPIYKKKDRTEISNYRPITLLNTDYKLFTKVIAQHLLDNIKQMVHQDQTGFIPNQSIYNNIRLATSIIKYAELANEDEAIVTLDQKKGYDKIRHDYLWKTLEKFNTLTTFIKTVKTLYENAHTCVAINGMLSQPYQVTCGVCQRDPLSYTLFGLAIEPLACKLRNDPGLEGLNIPRIEEKIIVSMFTDDANIFLGHNDRMDYVQEILNE